MVSHTLGWFKEFRAVPGVPETSEQQSESHSEKGLLLYNPIVLYSIIIIYCTVSAHILKG